MGLRRRRSGLTALAGLAAGAGGAGVALHRFLLRVEVAGDSMKPTLWPGDRVLAVRSRRVRAGDLVVLRDPRRPDRLLVKRVTGVATDGSGLLTVEGDNPGASTDSRSFGEVGPSAVVGRVVRRYAVAEAGGGARPLPARAPRGVTSDR